MAVSSDLMGSPPTSAAPAAVAVLTTGAMEIEQDIRKDAKQRHYAGIYEMQTNTAVDQSAKEVMASPEVREAFRLLNECLSTSNESAVVGKIEEVDKSVRRMLGVETSDYGGLMKIENYPMATVSWETPIGCWRLTSTNRRMSSSFISGSAKATCGSRGEQIGHGGSAFKG